MKKLFIKILPTYFIYFVKNDFLRKFNLFRNYAMWSKSIFEEFVFPFENDAWVLFVLYTKNDFIPIYWKQLAWN